jgi:hypothetical protein
LFSLLPPLGERARGFRRFFLKIRGLKLRNGVNWQGTLKEKGVKQTGIKQGLDMYEVLLGRVRNAAVRFHPHIDAILSSLILQRFPHFLDIIPLFSALYFTMWTVYLARISAHKITCVAFDYYFWW